MHWFTGSIPEAIGESRRKGLIFVVYVEGWLNLSVLFHIELPLIEQIAKAFNLFLVVKCLCAFSVSFFFTVLTVLKVS